METAKARLGELSHTNQYLVSFSALSDDLRKHMKRYANASEEFSTRRLGLLCSEASLPSSTYATAEVKDNYLGVTQEFAHTRMYADTDVTFYVDSNYDTLRFFEGWMDYISGAGEAQSKRKGYYRRFAYPDQYKVDTMSITKFEKNAKGSKLQYDFVNAFPKGMTSIPLSYGPAEILKVTVTFNYDRYVIDRSLTNLELSDRVFETKFDPKVYTDKITLLDNLYLQKIESEAQVRTSGRYGQNSFDTSGVSGNFNSSAIIDY